MEIIVLCAVLVALILYVPIALFAMKEVERADHARSEMYRNIYEDHQ